jgi:hypothetical protein
MGQNSQMDDNNLDNRCNLALPTEQTNRQITPTSSPRGVDHHLFLVDGTAKDPTKDGSPQDHATPPNRGVHISKTKTQQMRYQSQQYPLFTTNQFCSWHQEMYPKILIHPPKKLTSNQAKNSQRRYMTALTSSSKYSVMMA